MIDRINKRILNLLQKDCRISNQDLAEQVALSPSPCLRRVKQLEDEGYIKQYVALLDPEKLDLNLTILISVGLNSHATKIMENFKKIMCSLPEVVQCCLIAGQTADYLLTVIVPDMEAYHDFLLKKLTRIEGVNTVHSSFVLEKIIDKTALPLEHIKESKT